MTFLKIAATSFVFFGLSMTAQAGTANDASAANNTHLAVQKVRTVRIIKEDITLPAPRKIATHSTRSVTFYAPTKARIKVIAVKDTHSATPNLFKN